MIRHKSWRLIAVLIVILALTLILNTLFTGSKDKISILYTGDLAYYVSETLSEIKTFLDSQEAGNDIQAALVTVQKRFPDINSAAIVEGRKFIAHSDASKIDTKINKEIFDAQTELKKNARKSELDDPYVIWQRSEADDHFYTVYYPVEIDGKITGLVYIQLTDQTLHPVNFSNYLMFVLMAILALLIILIDRWIPKFSFIPGIILFILTVVLIINLIAVKFQTDLNTWNATLSNEFGSLNSELVASGYDVDLSIADMELPLTSSISNWKLTISFLGFLLLLFILTGAMEKFFETLIKHKLAYAYIFPAMFGVFLLVFFPFVYGWLIGFTDYNLTNFGGDLMKYFSNFKNYGFDNFVNILKVVSFKDYSNFYFTFAHTIVWTVLNLFFHVSIGVILALVLNNAKLKGRMIFRILLILPWAIPNYITALIWRGMFHKQFGAVNGLLEMFGIEPISWFTAPVTAFLANLATNVWLGFPFMMIIALGALQSIPKELYEASAIDGSTKWQSFWNVTFPLLKPAMVPAIILGTIWTFNQFNVIYLVSGGGPDGATELLITDAYKLAFEQYRYGYASAYSIIIFLVLLTYGIITSRVTGATKGVYE